MGGGDTQFVLWCLSRLEKELGEVSWLGLGIVWILLIPILNIDSCSKRFLGSDFFELRDRKKMIFSFEKAFTQAIFIYSHCQLT